MYDKKLEVINMEIQKVSSGETVIARQKEKGSAKAVESFSSIVAKMTDPANIRDKLEEMNEARKEQKEHEQRMNMRTTERRIMPDGTIQVTELEGGKVKDRYRYHPEVIAVADPTKPPEKNPDGTDVPGTGGIKLRPHFNIFNM